MIKLIAMDIDGTLLNPEGEITPKTLETIRRYEELGVQFTIASGRSFFMLQSIREILKPKAPIICNNGCVVQDPLTGKVLYEKFLNGEVIKKLFNKLHELNIEAFPYPMTDTGIVVRKDTPIFQLFSGYTALGKPKDIRGFVETYVGKGNEGAVIMLQMLEDLNPTYVDNFDDISLDNIIHISLLFKEEQKEEIRQILHDSLGDSAEFVTTAANNFDIFSKNHNKGSGLEFLVQYMGLQREEVGAVGNEFNDVEMIEFAGIGVAMGNSPEFIKNKADLVVASNEEEGISEAIQKILQND